MPWDCWRLATSSSTQTSISPGKPAGTGRTVTDMSVAAGEAAEVEAARSSSIRPVVVSRIRVCSTSAVAPQGRRDRINCQVPIAGAKAVQVDYLELVVVPAVSLAIRWMEVGAERAEWDRWMLAVVAEVGEGRRTGRLEMEAIVTEKDNLVEVE
jgi:hypothetical protein